MIKAQRGTIDILPNDIEKWHYIENSARKITRLHNIKEVRTPIFEATELFARSSGESSDIVNKEMYTFLDKGERSITLKPEGTAGVVRACVEHGLFADTLPLKLYYISPVFRYEKPQAGRLREFRQFGVELFGSDSPKIVVEAIKTGYDFLSDIKIKNVVVKINSLGCEECRQNYTLALKKYFEDNKQLLCEDCNRRLEQNPLRILDCKVDSCRKLIEKAPKISDYLCENCKNYLQEVENLLKNQNLPYLLDYSIIRGLDYYTGIVFEYETSDIDGASAVVGAGGQYNNLAEELGGPQVSAVGFAYGMERLLMLLEKQNVLISHTEDVDVLIVSMSNTYCEIEQKLMNILRQNEISVDCDYIGRSFKSNFKYANKINAKYVLILGEEEVKNNFVTLKNMQRGEQKQISYENLVNAIKKGI